MSQPPDVDKMLGHAFLSVILLLATVLTLAFVPWPWVLIPVILIGACISYLITEAINHVKKLRGDDK